VTFTEIRDAVSQYCTLTSTEALTRVGKSINRHYRRVTSELGMEPSRFVTRAASMTVGVATLTVTSIERIDRILDVTSGVREIPEHTLDEVRTTVAGTGEPTMWALQSVAADAVTLLFDTQPQTAYDLQADGVTSLSDLSGTDEPVFAESFHDILTWSVIAEELLKKEKDKLADKYQSKADRLLNELKFHYADSPSLVLRQGNRLGSTSGSGASSGGTGGGTSYTQTGLITFDRDPSAPFAVTSGSAKVTNLDADLLDGQTGTAYHDATLLTGALPVSSLPSLGITNAHISASAAVAYSKLNLTGTLLNADVNASAAIAYAKLNLGTSILNTDINAAAAIASTKLDLSAIAQDLKFTDATYDIGKSAATRPRDGFFSRNVTVGGILTTAGQVAFPASQNASSDANTLDDYEEGTWTPNDQSGASLSFTTVLAHYVKIGQVVHVWGRLTFPSTGSGASVVIGGLPFTSQTVGSVIYTGLVSNSVGAVAAVAEVASNATTFAIKRVTATGTAVVNSDLTLGSIEFTFRYRASA
jgi:hypothetical protein